MIRTLFTLATLLMGVLIQMVLSHYLSLYDAAPQVFLILTITHGFIFGPIMGEVLGFSWGLMSDATGVRLFGMNALLLALAGYLAGHLRRRVASERPTAQLVISIVSTLYYAIGVSWIYSFFNEGGGKFSYAHFFLEGVYNAVFVTAFFVLTERWVQIWRIPQEHI